MAYLVQKDCVLIECDCGSLKPITKTYLCRYCLEIRCTFCINHEIDSSFCSNCLQSLPPGEARLKKNRCSSCLDCPSCFHTLSLRATSAGRAPSVEDSGSKATNKFFYLSCPFCRWSTRDVDLPDQTVAIGGWPEKEHVNSSRINELIDYYKTLVSRDIKEKEKKTNPNRRGFHSYHILGLSQSIARKKAGLPPFNYNRDVSVGTPPTIAPAEAVENDEKLPEEIFTESVDVSKITSLPQRFAFPEYQPEQCSDFYPIRKHLIVRRSARCWICEHNVVKPELQPISVKYKIKSLCYYHMPEIRILSVDPLHAGNFSNIVLKIINPFQYKITVQFEELKAPVPEVKNGDGVSSEETKLVKISELGLKADTCLTFGSRLKKINVTAGCDIDNQCFDLQPKDDAADFDDTVDLHPGKGEPDTKNTPVWTKNNKIAVRLMINPYNGLNIGEEVTVGFTMIYSYSNSLASSEAPQDVKVSANLFLTLGKICGA